MSSDEICVAHLVRRANGIGAFRNFLESYRRNTAGMPHELLLILKGFSRPEELAPYDAILDGVPHKRTFVSDFGYDVRPYVKAAREHAYRYFVFLNSFSRILIPGWLEMFYRHAARPGVGIVGATGSHQSIASDHHVFKWEIRKTLPAYKRALMPLHRYLHYVARIRGKFPPFPNYHVRTNAFMIGRDLINSLRTHLVLHKLAAYRFESGIGGMTHQIMAAGLTPLVVGADGRAYEPPQWPDARTFWISRQENLLIADNQTRAYDEGTPVVRERLAFHAWRRTPGGAPRTDAPPLPDNVRAITRCPQCGTLSGLAFLARDLNRGVTDEMFPYYRCGNCSVVFLQPVPPDLGRYYPAGYHEIPQSEAELLKARAHEQFKLDAIGAEGHGRRLLEIGPSYGRFAALAKRAGFDVQTIEMDRDCCAFIETIVGVPALHTADIAQALGNLGRFDVIAIWHALEHLRDPWALLDLIPEHLHAGGLLALASPNPRSLQFRLLGRNWVHVDAPRHVYLIPYELIQIRLARRGMRRVHLSTRDQGARDCNYVGWATWSRHVMPQWVKRQPFTGVASRLVTTIMSFEQLDALGAAYTAVFEKA